VGCQPRAERLAVYLGRTLGEPMATALLPLVSHAFPNGAGLLPGGRGNWGRAVLTR
jgi:hypothetical protein